MAAVTLRALVPPANLWSTDTGKFSDVTQPHALYGLFSSVRPQDILVSSKQRKQMIPLGVMQAVEDIRVTTQSTRPSCS